MTAPPYKFDELGKWSEVKLEIVEKYGAAYTRAFSTTGQNLKKYYVDSFSGAGVHISKTSGATIDGSPVRALRVAPPFDHLFFIDMDKDKTTHLQKLCKGRRDVTIHTGDASSHLVNSVLPKIRYENYNRALCLFDPYGLHLEWEAMRMAGQSRAIDMFLNFPVMDINRNAIWRNPEKAPPDGVERLTKFWGDDSWKNVAYVDHPQGNLFGAPDQVKQPNDAIVSAFQKRLQKVAGFAYVPAPLPMRNSRNAVVYYLFFASQKPVAKKIIEDIFKKHR